MFKTLQLTFSITDAERFEQLSTIFDRFCSAHFGRVEHADAIVDRLHSDLSSLFSDGAPDSAALAAFSHMSSVNFAKGSFTFSFTFRSTAEFSSRRIVALVHALGGTKVHAVLTDDSTGLINVLERTNAAPGA